MKYFTPELWIAFQGPRRNAAFKIWGRRLEQYRKSLERILPGLRPNARQFFRDALVLHDGTLTRMEVGDRIDRIDGEATRDIADRRTLRVRVFVLAGDVKQRSVTGKCWYILEYRQVERIGLSYPGDLKLFPVGPEPISVTGAMTNLHLRRRTSSAMKSFSRQAQISPSIFVTFPSVPESLTRAITKAGFVT